MREIIEQIQDKLHKMNLTIRIYHLIPYIKIRTFNSKID